MRIHPKLAALTMLTATAAFAGGGDHHWDAGHRSYSPWRDQTMCKLQLEDIYQPMGGSQPIHVKVRNVSHNRLKYTLSMAVDGKDAGMFDVDNANPGEVSDRDASKRYPGTLENSRIMVRVTSCSIRM